MFVRGIQSPFGAQRSRRLARNEKDPQPSYGTGLFDRAAGFSVVAKAASKSQPSIRSAHRYFYIIKSYSISSSLRSVVDVAVPDFHACDPNDENETDENDDDDIVSVVGNAESKSQSNTGSSPREFRLLGCGSWFPCRLGTGRRRRRTRRGCGEPETCASDDGWTVVGWDHRTNRLDARTSSSEQLSQPRRELRSDGEDEDERRRNMLLLLLLLLPSRRSSFDAMVLSLRWFCCRGWINDGGRHISTRLNCEMDLDSFWYDDPNLLRIVRSFVRSFL